MAVVITAQSGNDNIPQLIPDNKIGKATFLCYWSAIVIGIATPIAGIVSPQIAQHFHVLTAYIVFIDALTLVGIFIGNSISGVILEKLGGRKTLIFASFCMMLIQVGIGTQNSLLFYSILVFFSGFFMGLIVPTVSFLILAAYATKGKTAEKLNMKYFFVGLGSFIGPAFGGMLVLMYSWSTIFLMTAIGFMIVFITTIIINISEIQIKKEKKTKEKNKSERVIGLSVILVGIAMIGIVYAEYIISYWFSPYLQESLGISVKTVGMMIGAFWLTVTFGRLFFGKLIIPRMKEYKFIICSEILLIIGLILFVLTKNTYLIFAIIILLGIGDSAIFPTLLDFGVKQAKFSPKALAFITCCCSFGGALSLTTSAIIGAAFPKVYAIYMAPICCVFVIIFVLLAKYVSVKNQRVVNINQAS
jgi:MFS transporter, TsgA protein